MDGPFHLSGKHDVISWITEKNKETSVESARITYTCGPIQGFFSRIIGRSIPIQTKEGPIWISRNALNYLSVPEKQSLLPAIDQLSLHILAENKLRAQAHITPFSDEEFKAVNIFLSVFKLVLTKQVNPATDTKAFVLYFQESQAKTAKALSSSTPEFIIRLLADLPLYSPEKLAINGAVTKTQEAKEPIKEVIDDFLENTQIDTIPSVVTSLRTYPPLDDALFLRKFIHKIHTKNDIPSNKKLELLHALLLEYEKQSVSSGSTSGYTFDDFSHALIEEIFGPKNLKIGGYYYLNSILSLQKICDNTKQNIKDVLSPHMKETLELYLMLHPKKEVHGTGPLMTCLRKIDTEYKHPDEPTLWQRMTQISAL